jgi:hypothetical protein
MAEKLVRQHPDRIAEQLDYLPYRSAQDPAALLVEAIRSDWQPPALYLQAQSDAADARQEAEERRQLEDKRRDRERTRRDRTDRLEATLQELSIGEYDALFRRAREQLQQTNPMVAGRPDSPAYDALLREIVYGLLEESP